MPKREPRPPARPTGGGGGGGGTGGGGGRKCPSGFRWSKQQKTCLVIPPGQPGHRPNVWAFVGKKKKATAPRVDEGTGGGGTRKPRGLPMEGKAVGVPEEGFTPPVPDDGREYKWKDGTLNARINGRWYPVTQLFQEGDDVRLAPRTRDEILDLQIQLVNSGLLTPDALDQEAGAWGEKSRGAFGNVLKDANRAGIGWRDALAYRQENIELAGDSDGGGGGGGGEEIVQTSPEEIRLLADTTAREVYGRRLNDAEAQAFEAAFRQTFENPAAQFAPPSASAFAEIQLKKQNPQETAGSEVRSFVNEWEQLLASSKPVSGGPFAS